MCRAVFVLPVLFLAACAGDAEKHDRFKEQMMLGEQFYRNARFYEAIGRYTEAFSNAQDKREEYQSTLAVAEAATEYGLICYQQAEDFLRGNRNRPAGMQKWKEGDQWHDDANKAFHKCLEIRGDDTMANIGLGKLYYRRATAYSVLPFTENKDGVAARKAERDEAIRQFRIVLKPEKGDITLPEHGPDCRSPFAHRYLALSLLTRSNWDLNDCEEARRHMMVWLNYLTWGQAIIRDQKTSDDDQAKIAKEKRLEEFRTHTVETRSLLATQLKGLKDLVAVWKTGTEKPELPKEKREKWMLAAQREILALEEMTRKFEEASKPKKPKQPDPVEGS
jgi:tetratricopeptide (TPR) repeat protein